MARRRLKADPRCMQMYVAIAMSVLVGPVIGTVTHEAARILVEVDVTTVVTLTVRSTSHCVTVSKEVVQYTPIVFSFASLRPETGYTVAIHGFEHIGSHFRTFPVHPTLENRLHFAIVSCNKLRVTNTAEVVQQNDLWATLAGMIERNELSMVLHLGDQVYVDDEYQRVQEGGAHHSVTFLRARALMEQTPPSMWTNLRTAIMHMYREEYRRTWGHPNTRKALANIPNLMMYDDHEMFDDAGYAETDAQGHLLMQWGRCVAIEYQRVLHADIDPNEGFHDNCSILKIGEYGLIMADTRAARIFNARPGDWCDLLTDRQFNRIRDALVSHGLLRDCRVVLFATQKPMVLFGKVLTHIAAALTKALSIHGYTNFRTMWCYGKNELVQTEVLGLLYRWKMQNAVARCVVICGGDIHVGGMASLYHNGVPWCQQLTSGPIANTCALGPWSLWALNVVRNLGCGMPRGWGFCTAKFVGMRNFGVIRTRPTGQLVTGSLIVGTDTEIKEYKY